MFRNARTGVHGMVTGEPHSPVRHSWAQVHQTARRVAGGLAAAGIGPRRCGRRAGWGAGRDRADRPGAVDARCEHHDAAPTHAADRPAAVGPGQRPRHRHDRREGGDRLRAVHGRGAGAGGAGGSPCSPWPIYCSPTPPSPPTRSRRVRTIVALDAAHLGVHWVAQGRADHLSATWWPTPRPCSRAPGSTSTPT